MSSNNAPVTGSLTRALALLMLAASVASGGIVDSGSLSGWVPVFYYSTPDPTGDQQTGQYESDIVGNANHAALLTNFNNAGTPSLIDGTIYYRIRLGGDASPAGFKNAGFIGVDANNDGALDAFIGVDNSGSHDSLNIWNPGTGTNTSPSTTSIASTPFKTYTTTASNYSWRQVSLALDGGTSVDIDGGSSGTDYYLSYAVPFADLVSYFSSIGISVNENSPFKYVFATATQANSLNQDIGAVNGGVNSSSTFASLGAMSTPYSASGVSQVPEPGSAVLLLVAMMSVFRRSRR